MKTIYFLTNCKEKSEKQNILCKMKMENFNKKILLRKLAEKDFSMKTETFQINFYCAYTKLTSQIELSLAQRLFSW